MAVSNIGGWMQIFALGDLHDEDAEGKDLHPSADIGNGHSGDEQTEVAGAEGVEQRSPPVLLTVHASVRWVSDLGHDKTI